MILNHETHLKDPVEMNYKTIEIETVIELPFISKKKNKAYKAQCCVLTMKLNDYLLLTNFSRSILKAIRKTV